MKKPLLLLATLLAMGSSDRLAGQSATAKKSGAPTPETTSTNAAQHAAAPAPAVIAGKSTNDSVATQSTLLSFHDLGTSTNAMVVSSGTARLNVLESERTRMEGGLVPLVKRPSVVTFLQLFNPFAPAEYGGMQQTSAGEGFGRIFFEPGKSGPSSVLFSIGENPPKSSATGKAGDN